MPAHVPVVLGLGLSFGVATAVYLNRDKIKDFYLQKKRELENELRLINGEIREVFHPERDIELYQNPSESSVSTSSNPFTDAHAIDPTATANNVSELEIDEEEDDLYHSYNEAQGGGAIKKRTNIQRKNKSESSDAGSDVNDEKNFFSYIEDEDFSTGSREPWTTGGSETEWGSSGFNTPTASEAGDYALARNTT